MDSRNGVSKYFKITIDDSIELTFSFKHQALLEWTQEKWVVATTLGGVFKQKFLYFHTYFKIDWSQLIVGADSDKLQQVRNAEYNGSKIDITPHIDLPGRHFDVVTLKSDNGDSEKIQFSQIRNHRTSEGNKDMIMTFRTKYPQYSWDIRDPSAQQGISSTSFERFI